MRVLVFTAVADLRFHCSFKMNSYYEDKQDACLNANGQNLEVVQCPQVLNDLVAWKVDDGYIKYGDKCLFHESTSNSAATVKACDPSRGSDSFVSIIPYRSSPYGSDPYTSQDSQGLSNIFPTR